MYLSVAKSEQLIRQLIRYERGNKILRDIEIIVAPSMLALSSVSALVKQSRSKIKIAAQDCGIADAGAFTGGISSSELKKMGARYVIIGHAERRQFFNEDAMMLSKKISAAHKAGLGIIYCVGETQDERHAARAGEVVREQLRVVQGVTPALIAYEPRWAIGTGLAIEPHEAEHMHASIAREVRGVPICYGGSVNEKNIAAFINLENTRGVLVGSASTTFVGCSEMLGRMSKIIQAKAI